MELHTSAGHSFRFISPLLDILRLPHQLGLEHGIVTQAIDCV
jgi:hypothetical protein